MLSNKIKNAAEIALISVIDLLSVFAVFQVAIIIRTELLPNFYAGFPHELPFSNFISVWWVFLVWSFFFYYEGIYTKRFSFWDELKILWKVSFFSTVGVFTIVSIGKLGADVSRTVIILMGFLAILLLPLIRIGCKKILKGLGLLKRKVIILGAGQTGKLIANALRKEPNYGYDVVGFLDDDPQKVGNKMDGIKIHKGVDRAVTYLRRANISDVFIAMPGAGKERIQGLMNNLQHNVDRILFVPDMFGIAVVGTSLQHFFGEQAFALEMKNNLSRPFNIVIKKFFDMVISFFMLIFLAIPILIIAFIIKFDSKGSVFFSQERAGKNGRKFRLFKFRTMYSDSESRLKELLSKDSIARDEWEKNWKLKDDPRITLAGKFLRITSLDELPQLFNVIKGEMSLVGPRPVRQEELEKYYKDKAELCFSVLPGMTGLWQVSGRSSTGYDYRIALDLWYVRNWNLWLDIVILLKTVGVVLRREGAY